ncbi:granzyme H isoform X2 [Electrophorus electricus]|uniref:granzyme H isoform X2 n=1 Tax=Electrophorus electricus TaxID=8005 RepID=UPI0015D08F5C|nr:granzyme H isoform X2 [Electrophorus electricus]
MSILQFYFLLLHLFTQGGALRQGVIGGRESVPHSRPYMVFTLDLVTQESCDGFLVTKDFVMTAAHCSKRVIAFLGMHNKNELRIGDAILVEPFPHPKYNSSTFENDIMLLKLQKPAELSNRVRTIALPLYENETFTHNCLVMGWGSQTANRTSPSKVLREANVTTGNCTLPHIICSEGFTGPGSGDSGGPLICGDVAQGIVSNRIKKTFAARYTRISHYLGWIYSVIKKPHRYTKG